MVKIAVSTLNLDELSKIDNISDNFTLDRWQVFTLKFISF